MSADFFTLKVSSLKQEKAVNELTNSQEMTETTTNQNKESGWKEDDIVSGSNKISKKDDDQSNNDASSSCISSSVDDCMSPARMKEAMALNSIARPVFPKFSLQNLLPNQPEKKMYLDEKLG
jgi:hypothetical protein